LDRKCTLLIVDRNPFIRSFLKRELEHAGYQIVLAANGRQTLEWLHSTTPLDLIILDPDLPDAQGVALFQEIHVLNPDLPVIVHTLASEYDAYAHIPGIAVRIEKCGNSIEGLKEVVHSIYPHNSR